MRTARTVVEFDHAVVRAVECTEHRRGCSQPEASPIGHLVLVRKGFFRLHDRGRCLTVDPTTGYLLRPGQEARFSHPSGGDHCTSISVHSAELLEGLGASPRTAVKVDARLELAHRMLLHGGDDPDFAAAESVVQLLELAVRAEPDERPSPGRTRLVEQAREAILADDPSSSTLMMLAAHLGVSPHYLSRTFSHHAGMSLTRYRNRIRVSRALQRLDDGESDLAGLAASLGFSDQSHLTRTLRQEVGRTPYRLRQLLQ